MVTFHATHALACYYVTAAVFLCQKTLTAYTTQASPAELSIFKYSAHYTLKNTKIQKKIELSLDKSGYARYQNPLCLILMEEDYAHN